MVITEMRTRHVPMEVLGFEIDGEHVGQQCGEPDRDVGTVCAARILAVGLGMRGHWGPPLVGRLCAMESGLAVISGSVNRCKIALRVFCDGQRAVSDADFSPFRRFYGPGSRSEERR